MRLKIIHCLSLYLYVYYFFIRALYAYYSLNIYVYRTFFILPFIIWCILIIQYYIENFHDLKTNKFINIFLFMFFYMLVYISCYGLFGLEYVDKEAMSYQVINLGYSVLNILLGFYLYVFLKEKKFISVFLGIWMIYTVILISNLNGVTLDKHGLSGIHLMLGDTYVIITLIALGLFKSNNVAKFVVISLGLFLVFVIGSRATFYSFIVVYAFFFIKTIGVKNSSYIFILMVLLFIIDMEFFHLLKLNDRMFGVFEGKSDGSLNERLEQFKYGIDAIKNHWFLGEFAGQNIVHEHGYRSGTMGAYMHNWLSYWRQYGLVFFMLFTMLYLYGIFSMFKQWLYKNNFLVDIVFYLALFIGVELLLFRSYGSPYPYFIFPLMFRYIYEAKYVK